MNEKNILGQLDRLFQEKRISEVEPFLTGSIEYAKKEDDKQLLLSLYNELTGYYRSVGKTEEAIKNGRKAEAVIEELELYNTKFHATTLVNLATAYRSAGKHKTSLEIYQKAQCIYENVLTESDVNKAGLYNNMSMAYQGLGEYRKAIKCLNTALKIVKSLPKCEQEVASTYINFSTVYFEMKNYEEGILALQEALKIYENKGEKDSHYSALLASLAHGYYLKKDLEKSVEYYTKALKEILEFHGECESYSITCENCAIVLEESGFLQQAEYLRKKAKDARIKQKRNKGMDISRMYYEKYGEKMLREKFPECFSRITVGLIGHGSECFGFDDIYSTDHDFGPAFCVWLEETDAEKYAKEMKEEYEKLPKSFGNIPAREISAHGENRIGILKVSTFYEEFLGKKLYEVLLLPQNYTIEEKENAWASVPETALAQVTAGEIFKDGEGTFSYVQRELQKGYPYGLKIRKIAQMTALTAQAGQYNYLRCAKRGEYAASEMALREFVQASSNLIYLLNNTFMPYYKWMFRKMKTLPKLSEAKEYYDQLFIAQTVEEKSEIIEEICSIILKELKKQNLTEGEESFLEIHVERILRRDSKMNIMEKIVELEWEMFQKVRNTGGRASCQDDFETFDIMRKSQFSVWREDVLNSYWKDLTEGEKQGRNLIMEKYAYMMESSSKEEYETIKDDLPLVSEEKAKIIEGVVSIQVEWREEFASNYPYLSKQARLIHTSEDEENNISFETYLRGELKTYSLETLVRYAAMVVDFAKQGINMVEEIMRQTTKYYGYATIDEAEEKQIM
ncbi:DUF4125 family protein [Faecalimonas sp.]